MIKKNHELNLLVPFFHQERGFLYRKTHPKTGHNLDLARVTHTLILLYGKNPLTIFNFATLNLLRYLSS